MTFIETQNAFYLPASWKKKNFRCFYFSGVFVIWLSLGFNKDEGWTRVVRFRIDRATWWTASPYTPVRSILVVCAVQPEKSQNDGRRPAKLVTCHQMQSAPRVWSSATFLLVRLLGEAIRRECNNGWAAMTVCLLSKRRKKPRHFHISIHVPGRQEEEKKDDVVQQKKILSKNNYEELVVYSCRLNRDTKGYAGKKEHTESHVFIILWRNTVWPPELPNPSPAAIDSSGSNRNHRLHAMRV